MKKIKIWKKENNYKTDDAAKIIIGSVCIGLITIWIMSYKLIKE